MPLAAKAQSGWDQSLPQVKQKCVRENPDDFSMQAFCIRMQHEGWTAVNGGEMPNASSPAQAIQLPPVTTSDKSGAMDIQAKFSFIIAQYQKLYHSAANDMQKGALRPKRGQELCEAMATTDVRDWHGIVYSLSGNGDGNDAIEIDLGSGVYVRTMTTSLSDAGYRTLIPLGTPYSLRYPS